MHANVVSIRVYRIFVRAENRIDTVRASHQTSTLTFSPDRRTPQTNACEHHTSHGG